MSSDNEPLLDPAVRRHVEREYKIANYDDMRVTRAAAVALSVGLAIALLSQLIARRYQ